jgi:hypothetical protein
MKWWERMAHAFSGEDLQGFVRDRLENDPAARNALFESLRNLSNALDDSVVPALADLTAEYLREHKPADAFFRGVQRVLSDLTAGEFESLRDLMVAVAAIPVSKRTITLSQHGDPKLVHYSTSHRREPIGSFGPHTQRIFHLLKVNGLGADFQGGSFGAQPGPKSIALALETIRRLSTLLAPSNLRTVNDCNAAMSEDDQGATEV